MELTQMIGEAYGRQSPISMLAWLCPPHLGVGVCTTIVVIF
jgi:hypothetical protein